MGPRWETLVYVVYYHNEPASMVARRLSYDYLRPFALIFSTWNIKDCIYGQISPVSFLSHDHLVSASKCSVFILIVHFFCF